MIVRSVRLKNIKCYADDVTVQFERGLNHISGLNGHGKTTLIESIGYALFETEPIYEETFDTATYLLRAGAKAGEIDVTFEHGQELWRVERGLGSQTKRRSKVVQLSDGSIAAEGDAEVRQFVCRLFGLANTDRLKELFAKLVGIKQGRLTLPFDSGRKAAREYFEPLLDVEIFRACFERLKPVVDCFSEQRTEHEKRLEGVKERIRDRRDAPEQLTQRQTRVSELEKSFADARRETGAAENRKLVLEQKEAGWQQAERAWLNAQNACNLARERRATAEDRFKQAADARLRLIEKAPAYDGYNHAEKLLAELFQQQRQKSELDTRRASASQELTALRERAKAARQQAAMLQQQQSDRDKEITALKDRLVLNASEMEQAHADFANARQREAAHQEQVERLAAELKGAEQSQKILQRQLEQISGGVCPFLKEQCRQFDQAKVQGDLQNNETAAAALHGRVRLAREEWHQSKALVSELTSKHAKSEQLRQTLQAHIEKLAAESGPFQARIGSKIAEAEALDRQERSMAVSIQNLEEALKSFAGLEAQIDAQHKSKVTHLEGYRAYLGAKPAADQMEAHDSARRGAADAEKQAQEGLSSAEEFRRAAQRDFDATALHQARKEHEEKRAALSAIDAKLHQERHDLEIARNRFAEHQAALKEKQALDAAIGRLTAAITITQKARNILQHAAPFVAQHLCNRIAGRAQQVFNAINHEPAELSWPAERYGLRIQPGERRFAMLSGGEQTKLAVAMTLAMIEEFSALKFCIFDEPTYSVDAQSRQRLADAIIAAQQAAGMEQIIVVSHDDAFHGKIEHTVLLRKSAGWGTQVVPLN